MISTLVNTLFSIFTAFAVISAAWYGRWKIRKKNVSNELDKTVGWIDREVENFYTRLSQIPDLDTTTHNPQDFKSKPVSYNAFLSNVKENLVSVFNKLYDYERDLGTQANLDDIRSISNFVRFAEHEFGSHNTTDVSIHLDFLKLYSSESWYNEVNRQFSEYFRLEKEQRSLTFLCRTSAVSFVISCIGLFCLSVPLFFPPSDVQSFISLDKSICFGFFSFASLVSIILYVFAYLFLRPSHLYDYFFHNIPPFIRTSIQVAIILLFILLSLAPLYYPNNMVCENTRKFQAKSACFQGVLRPPSTVANHNPNRYAQD